MAVSMQDRLGQLKEFLSNHVFDNDPVQKRQDGADSPTRAVWKGLLDSTRFSTVLPFEYYDEECELFFNDDSFGFIIEITPATSLTEENIRVLAGVLGSNVAPETNLQFINYASPDVYPTLNAWYKARSGQDQIYRELARRRVDYLAGGTWKSFFSDEAMVIRDFRLFAVAQRPLPESGKPRDTDIEGLERLRSGIMGTLQSMGLSSIKVSPDAFINLLDTMINPREFRTQQLRWQKDLELAEQVVDADTAIYVGSKGLLIENGEESRDVRCYTVREYPQACTWSGK